MQGYEAQTRIHPFTQIAESFFPRMKVVDSTNGNNKKGIRGSQQATSNN